MPERNNQSEVGETACDENLEEMIYHLDLESELIKKQGDLADCDRDSMFCASCGDRATWYTSEIKHEIAYYRDTGRVNTWWCDSCFPEKFLKLWKAWPWTPDDQLDPSVR